MRREPSITFSISWLTRILRTRFDARARGLGLTRAQWRVIATVGFDEGVTQSEVAAKMEIRTATVGRIIDRLEAAGWLERRTDPGDRRANRLYLTSVATPMLERLGGIGASEEQIALAGMTAQEQEVLAGLLDRMIANLRAAALDVEEPGGDMAFETAED